VRMPNTDLDAEASARLAEIIQRNDAALKAAGLTPRDAVRLNIEHARELLRKRRAGK
jgi:hypothetical protein